MQRVIVPNSEAIIASVLSQLLWRYTGRQLQGLCRRENIHSRLRSAAKSEPDEQLVPGDLSG